MIFGPNSPYTAPEHHPRPNRLLAFHPFGSHRHALRDDDGNVLKTTTPSGRPCLQFRTKKPKRGFTKSERRTRHR